MKATAPAAGSGTVVNFALLLLMGLTWGSSFLFVEVALDSVTPVTLAAGRIVLGATILALAARLLGQQVPGDWKTLRIYFLLGMTSHAAPFSLIAMGQAFIDSSLAAILISSVPLFTLMMAHFYTVDDRITPAKAIGVLMGFGGIVLLIGPAALAGLGHGFWGKVMVIGAAFCFALTTLIARQTRHVPPVMSGACSLFSAALWIVPASLLFDRPWTLTPTAMSIWAIVALALFSTSLGMLAFFRLTQSAGPNFISLNNYISPVVAVLWGVTLLGERLSWTAIVAMLIILAGIAVSTIKWRALASGAKP